MIKKSIFTTSFHIKHFIAGRTQANYIKSLMIFRGLSKKMQGRDPVQNLAHSKFLQLYFLLLLLLKTDLNDRMLPIISV